ncbi:hypothetical protein C9374_004691 [Naegleria lovaniensis]|uniref:Protein YIPF n=1 Tax=Naegleria lovaniensis TaxID=51637 RepID=A0AA88GLV3_NAELO|nr:uncharacterized protein C9374_004691 [Naegleria lovaniensis]KAG2383354.1 hypothetical protein C9374_004691 [Naegleria lovaniensis]
MIANRAQGTTTILPEGSDQPHDSSHGFVIGKTQEFLKSKGFGWLMEVDASTESKENLLGGESVEQPSIMEELDIDLEDILFKVKKVMIPFGKFSADDLSKLREPDFWGPFFIVLAYALLVEITYLQLRAITWMYLIWLVGSCLIWMLGRLFTPSTVEEARALKSVKKDHSSDFQPLPSTTDHAQFPSGNLESTSSSGDSNLTAEEEQIIEVGYSQVMSCVGYSLIPHVLALLVLLVWRLIFERHSLVSYYVSLLLNLASFGWSTVSCLYLFTAENYYLNKKRKLLVIPILLLYLYFFSMQSGV